MVHWKSLLPTAVIEKMCSFIRPTTNSMYREQSYWIWNRVLSMLFKTRNLKISLMVRTYGSIRTVAVRAIIGLSDIIKQRKYGVNWKKYLNVKQRMLIVWKDLLWFIRLLVVQVVEWDRF